MKAFAKLLLFASLIFAPLCVYFGDVAREARGSFQSVGNSYRRDVNPNALHNVHALVEAISILYFASVAAFFRDSFFQSRHRKMSLTAIALCVAMLIWSLLLSSAVSFDEVWSAWITAVIALASLLLFASRSLSLPVCSSAFERPTNTIEVSESPAVSIDGGADERPLYEIGRRLAEAKFVLQCDVEHGGVVYPLVARRTRFELTKFGFCETIFVFRSFEHLTKPALRSFSADAFRCAMKKCVVPLPRGLFECVLCFPVAMVRFADNDAVASLRNEAPPKHWAAAEMPVLCGAGVTAYFEKTPLWGGAYYNGLRRLVRQFVGEYQLQSSNEKIATAARSKTIDA
jgi:hypothetical protein